MKVGQLRDLGVAPRAALALLGRRLPWVPHEVVGDQLSTALERVQQGHRAVLTDQRESWVHLDHRQLAACRGDRIALTGVRLLADPQGIELGLKRAPIGRDRSLHWVGYVGFCWPEFARLMVHGYLDSRQCLSLQMSRPAILSQITNMISHGTGYAGGPSPAYSFAN